MAKIRSQHVVRVIDTGKMENGTPFMVMEYLEGKDLSGVLEEEGRVPIDVAVDYVLQACEAMAEAHAVGIVHRDLKPANLFLAKQPDRRSIVKVLDFGISKVVDPKSVVPVQQSTCSQKWDAYHRSQDCFAPFFIRNGKGGSILKPEAFQVCVDVPSPAMVCDYDNRAGK